MDFRCTRHMDKDASLLYSLIGALEEKICVVDDNAVTFTGIRDVTSQNGCISNVYHVPITSAIFLSVSQLTNTKKTVEFWLDRFVMKDIRCVGENLASIILDPKDGIYKLCDSWMSGMITLVAHVDERKRIWHG